jgi:hypothetical protein
LIRGSVIRPGFGALPSVAPDERAHATEVTRTIPKQIRIRRLLT